MKKRSKTLKTRKNAKPWVRTTDTWRTITHNNTISQKSSFYSIYFQFTRSKWCKKKGKKTTKNYQKLTKSKMSPSVSLKNTTKMQKLTNDKFASSCSCYTLNAVQKNHFFSHKTNPKKTHFFWRYFHVPSKNDHFGMLKIDTLEKNTKKTRKKRVFNGFFKTKKCEKHVFSWHRFSHQNLKNWTHFQKNAKN